MKLLDATDAELEVLKLVLRELRDAVATNQQLSVHVDAWLRGGGVNVCVVKSSAGYSRSIEGEFRKRKSRRKPK